MICKIENFQIKKRFGIRQCYDPKNNNEQSWNQTYGFWNIFFVPFGTQNMFAKPETKTNRKPI